MRNPEGVEVLVKSVQSDEAHEEYAEPDADRQVDPYAMATYIEAVTGEQFAVVVKIPADFEYYRAEGVKIEIRTGKVGGYRFFAKPSACGGECIEYVNDVVPYYINGQWKHCNPSFKEVEKGKAPYHRAREECDHTNT